MLGVKDLIYRYRHNRGYGVQSPYAFHFVTAVVAEKHAFYAYSTINKAAAKCGYKAARARLLFRVANYARSHSIIMCEPCEAASQALTLARPSAQTTLIDASAHNISAALGNGQPLGLLYVGASKNYAPVVEQALGHASSSSIIIVEGIHSSREKRNWWQRVKQNPAVAVTFDLYSMGILFFDKNYRKQHYTLKK